MVNLIQITDKHIGKKALLETNNRRKVEGIIYVETFIVDNNLIEEFEKFIRDNHKNLNKYFKPRYIDYSHLAYNGVTDDF